MIRVLVADDHELIREGLRKMFGRESDIELVAAVTNAAEAIARIREGGIDVAVLDLNMPGRSGLDAIAQINTVSPKLPVLILSMLPARDVALRVFKAGGAGFVSKESAAEEIVAAVRRVASGKTYVSPIVADQLAASIRSPSDGLPHDLLSDRELQILRQIAAGQSTRKIAVELCLSTNTIATYRRRIREKLGLGSDVEIARYAIENKLVD